MYVKQILSVFALIMINALSFFAQKSKSFREEFTDNKNNWAILDNENYHTEIKDGKYHIHYKKKEKIETNPFVVYNKINVSHPFSVELRIKQLEVINAEMPNTYGIIIGEKDRGNAHYYTVSQSQKMSTWYYYQQHKYHLIQRLPLTFDNFSKEEAKGTKIFIKYQDGYLYFYVNNEFMARIAKPSYWFGNGIGIYVSSGMKMAIDYIEIKSL